MKWHTVCLLYLEWFKTYYKITTYDTKSRRVKNHAINLSNGNIEDIKACQIYEFILKIKKEISLSRANRVLSDIKQIFHFYKTFYDLAKDESEKIIPLRDYSIKSESDFKSINIDDITKFFKSFTANERKIKLLFEFTLLSGCRFGEVCGLTVSNFKYDENLVFINSQLQYICVNKRYEVISPKSSKSVRYVLLPKKFSNKLKRFIDTNNLGNDDFIFFGKRPGRYITKTVVYNKLKEHCIKAGIPIFNFHNFRKIKASLMLDYGLEKSIVTSTLGHESIKTTYDSYYLQSNETIKALSNFESKLYDLID